eukprot:44099_1
MGKESKLNITKKNQSILKKLIQHKLNLSTNKFPEYINQTFEMFCNHKSELIFNLHYINEFFSPISDVIMHPILNNKELKEKKNSKLSNVFKQNIFKLFGMVSRIEMESTDKQGKLQYPMNKKALLESIKPLQMK